MKRLLLVLQLFIITLSMFSSELTSKVLGYYDNEDYKMIIDILELEESLTHKETYLLAESYLFSITDANTWMKYNSKYQEAIVKCLEHDPENILYQINSARGMMWFPSARGNREDGINIILNLEKTYPDHPEVIYVVSNYRYGNDLINEAKIGYKRILEIDTDNVKAREKLDTIELNEKNLVIRNITFKGSHNISNERLSKKILFYNGTTLNKDTRTNIIILLQVHSLVIVV